MEYSTNSLHVNKLSLLDVLTVFFLSTATERTWRWHEHESIHILTTSQTFRSRLECKVRVSCCRTFAVRSFLNTSTSASEMPGKQTYRKSLPFLYLLFLVFGCAVYDVGSGGWVCSGKYIWLYYFLIRESWGASESSYVTEGKEFLLPE